MLTAKHFPLNDNPTIMPGSHIAGLAMRKMPPERLIVRVK